MCQRPCPFRLPIEGMPTAPGTGAPSCDDLHESAYSSRGAHPHFCPGDGVGSPIVTVAPGGGFARRAWVLVRFEYDVAGGQGAVLESTPSPPGAHHIS